MNRKKEILELTLKLDLKVKEYKELEKKYEENKNSLKEDQLILFKNKYEKTLKEIQVINTRLKELNKE